MSENEFTWRGGTHSFHLGLGEIRALQKVCDAGPLHIFSRLAGATWLVDDVIETITQGLSGGGMDIAEARQLVNREIVETDLYFAHTALASEVIGTILISDPDQEPDEDDDPVGKTDAAAWMQNNFPVVS